MSKFLPVWFPSNKKTSSSNNTTSLAPKILTTEKDLSNIKPYLDSLKNGIDSSQILNIGFTGPYGSGKSTLLRTFQNQHKYYNYLNISLASFKDEIEKNQDIHKNFRKEKEEITENIERLIEVSILQQIFYHVNPAEIPDSRFKRIKGITDNKLTWISIGFVIWITITTILFKFNFIDQLNPKKWTWSYNDLNYSTLFLFIFFFCGIGFFISKLVRILTKSKISKFSILGEVELGDDLDKSILNKHLDEILYFFENTKYNVVIIEDLDRFRNTEIFTKLREINLLINNSKLIKRSISFIYAIRDDMFQNQERTKFFDHIIPVIPFINPSNASDKLTEIISQANLKDSFTDDFIDDVITFIDDIDMRLLLNIFQEFTIYRQTIGESLIQNNLLAIIIYKNLYPADFVKLHKRKGILYEFINNKSV